MRRENQPTLAQSWLLFKRTGTVLLKDPELLVFPFLSLSLLVLLVCFMNATGLLAIQLTFSIGSVMEWMAIYLLLVLGYSLVLFSNTALIGSALKRFEGGDPGLAYGLEVAIFAAPQILAYAAFSASIGLALRLVSGKNRGLARIASGLAGYAWGMATFFVLPVLINEKVSVTVAIQRSASLLKSTWGEQIVGIWGLFMLGMLLFLFVLVVGCGASMAAEVRGYQTLATILFLAIPATVVVLVFVSSVLNAIYCAALYRYAQSGYVSNGFTDEMIAGAFAERKPSAPI